MPEPAAPDSVFVQAVQNLPADKAAEDRRKMQENAAQPLSLLTEGYDADAKVKLHQCGSTVRLSVNGRGRRDLLIGR